MRDAYNGVRTRIEENLSGLLQAMQTAEAAGETITPFWFTQEKRYKALLRQVEDELLALAEAQTPELIAAQRSVCTIAEDYAPQLATAALGTPPESAGKVTLSWNHLPASAVEAIVGSASDGSPLADLLTEWGVDTARKLKDELITGAALGLGAKAIARNVQVLVGDIITTDTDGKKTTEPGITRSRAETIVRTELHRASRLATRDAYAQNADVIEGWVWIAACDSRCCACCWALHGTIWPLADKLNGHPSCRCTLAPRTKTWAQFLGDATLPDTRPEIETGESRFAQLKADEQKEILGPGLHALYVAGSISLADCVAETHSERWGSMRRPATLAEAQANASTPKTTP